MIRKIIEDKRILSFYIIVFIGLSLGFTYALSTASIVLNVTTALITVDEDSYGNTSFDATNLDFVPILDSEVETRLDNVVKIDFTVGGASTNNTTNIIYDIALADLDIDCSLISPYIKWKLIKDGTELSNGTFSYQFDTIKDNRLVLTNIQEDLPKYNANKSGYHNYTFYMWFSDSCQEENISSCVGKADQSALLGKYFTGRIEVELYTKSKKALVRTPSASLNTSTCINTVTVNKPNLDNGNLIPVYYDNSEEVWKKADVNNKNNSWYNYNMKKWANAVIVDTSKKNTYQSADVGTTITDSDIIAFYVWIPRYKYRVWNMNRQGGAESTYAYPAYSKGIQIEFEQGTTSTGNVRCEYDIETQESSTTLSDNCYYNNGTTPIKITDANTYFTGNNEAWYTHPAFTFGTDSDKEKSGIWVGKFETGNTTSIPKILPDIKSLKAQNLSTQFTVSKQFQLYLSAKMDTHLITNLEWGAVTYLMHSIYGLCNGTTCQGMYINNSSDSYTGRSGGAIAGSTTLNLANVYPNDTTETTQYNKNGYYTYKGYFIDYNGNITTNKDVSKISSTTGNITGIYDMNGGSYEYVMANMVDTSYNFYPASAGDNWNGSTTLDSKYYNSYSYGTSYNNTLAFNRARLGDATAEVLGSKTSATGSWKIGSGTTGASSYFLYNTSPWYDRGGYSNANLSGPFFFSRNNGGSYLAFHSVIS